MSGTQGDLYRRLLELEREVNRLRAGLDVQPARHAAAADHRTVRLAVTARDPNTDTYPSEGSNPNTYWVKFVDADWSPKDDGSTTLSTYPRSEAPRVPARNLATGDGSYLAEGRLVAVVWNKGRSAAAGHWHIAAGGGGGSEPIRFRFTTSLSPFGTASGMRQKWDGAAYVDDGDFPDTVTLVDYVGAASTGDPNDKCFAVPMADRPDVFEVIEIQQAGAMAFVLFQLTQTLDATDDTATADAKAVYGGGIVLPAIDDEIELSNPESHVPGTNLFSSPNGRRGWAVWNGTNWSIFWMQPQAGEATPFVVFKINDTGGLTINDATIDALVVISYGAGLDPDDPITVRNFPSHDPGKYAFARPNGYHGIALWNGTDWSIVEMEPLPAAVHCAQIEFICKETVTTSTASFDAEVTRLIGDAALLGVEEEDEVTVFNRANITDYVFTGSNLTSVGLAQWDTVLERWDVVWITCPAS